MALATVAQLEVKLRVPVGSLAGVELAAANDALEEASTYVLVKGNPSWTDVTVPDIARIVTVRVAKRIYDNPDEKSRENLGDYGYSKANAEAFLTAGEIALVEQAAGFSYGVYSVATPSAYSETAE